MTSDRAYVLGREDPPTQPSSGSPEYSGIIALRVAAGAETVSLANSGSSCVGSGAELSRSALEQVHS